MAVRLLLPNWGLLSVAVRLLSPNLEVAVGCCRLLRSKKEVASNVSLYGGCCRPSSRPSAAQSRLLDDGQMVTWSRGQMVRWLDLCLVLLICLRSFLFWIADVIV